MLQHSDPISEPRAAHCCAVGRSVPSRMEVALIQVLASLAGCIPLSCARARSLRLASQVSFAARGAEVQGDGSIPSPSRLFERTSYRL